MVIVLAAFFHWVICASFQMYPHCDNAPKRFFASGQVSCKYRSDWAVCFRLCEKHLAVGTVDLIACQYTDIADQMLIQNIQLIRGDP